MEDSEESDNRYDRSVEQMEDYTVSTKQSKEETTGMQAADSTDGKAAVCEGGQGEEACACGHYKIIPRDAAGQKQLQNRINRIIGQLNGIRNMIGENRYCGDVLVQVAAVESALQSFAYLILQEHIETCVVEEIRKGNLAVVDEAVELMKKLK